MSIFLSAETQNPTSENVSLWKASKAGSVFGIENSLKKGASVEYCHQDDGGEGESCLLAAVSGGHVDATVALLKAGASVNIQHVATQNIALHLAAADSFPLTKILIEASSDVNKRNCYGNTPLLSAALAGNFETVELLLANGANVNNQNNKGSTAMHFISYSESRDLNIARALIKAKADINIRDQKGYTPLLAAVTTGKQDLIDLLLANGADPTSRSDAGEDIAAIAAFYKQNIHIDTQKRA